MKHAHKVAYNNQKYFEATHTHTHNPNTQKEEQKEGKTAEFQ